MFDLGSFIVNAPEKPGVYQMIDKQKNIIYIGKAKNLKNRLSHYRHVSNNDRVLMMVSKIDSIILTLTKTEEEALLLENNLIKSHRPIYNVLLKDDKSYPYIVLTDHPIPRLLWYRGKKNNRWKFFGPYPSIEIARTTIDLLMKVFLLRTCTDMNFANRARPCLNYQIKQCSAPCVASIQPEEYLKSVHQAVDFLTNSSSLLIDKLESKMIAMSQVEQYEQAREVRDHIRQLRSLQRKQRIDAPDDQRIDVLACELPYLHHLMILDGKIQRSEFIPVIDKLHQEPEAIIEEILNRLYDELPAYWLPEEVLINNIKTTVCVHSKEISLRNGVSDREKAWMDIALQSLRDNTSRHSHKNTLFQKRFHDLRALLNIEHLGHIDCVDISHHQGDQTVGAVVHCTSSGFRKDCYRRYLIQHEHKLLNNDVYSMHQTLVRHLKECQLKKRLPELLLVDGGLTQLQAAIVALEEVGCFVPVLAIAKGPGRRSGKETLFRWNPQLLEAEQLDLRAHEPAFLLLQQIRDEAHRFVITWQKKRQVHKSLSSPLDAFKGLGSEKKLQLLRTFGGWQGLIKISFEQLISIKGIGRKTAERLMDFLNHVG